MLDLNQHSALVTGSSQGIGLSIAQALAKSGAKICLHGLKKNSAAEEAIELVNNLHPELLDNNRYLYFHLQVSSVMRALFVAQNCCCTVRLLQ